MRAASVFPSAARVLRYRAENGAETGKNRPESVHNGTSGKILLKKGDKEQSIKRNYISLPVFVAQSANLIPTIY